MNEIYKNLSLENLEGEEWLSIEGYEGLYEVSNLGRVKSLRDNKGNYREKILSQCDNGNGYLMVVLCKYGKMQTCKVHRLVANAFIPNPNNFPTVNHKDEDKTNNCVDNLEWMNMKQQVNHGTAQQRRTAKTDWKAIAEKNSKRVYQYDKNHNLIKIWESTMEVGRNGFNQGHVAACCRGELKTHRGYIWSYYPI